MSMSRRASIVLVSLLVALAVAPAARAANGSLSGHVSGAGGNTVESGSVSLVPEVGTGYFSAQISSGGDYVVNNVTPGKYRVRFDPPFNSPLAPEYYDNASSAAAATLVTVLDGQPSEGINAMLDVGGVISGTVTDTQDKPVPGATVTVSGAIATRTVTTNSSGVYTASGLPTGNYTLRFQPAAGQNLTPEYYDNARLAEDATPVAVTAGASVGGRNATLSPGATISGTVTRAAGGSAVANVGVYASKTGSGQGTFPAYAQTKADGTYTIVGLEEGSYSVSFSPPTSTDLIGEYFDNAREYDGAEMVHLDAAQARGDVNASLEGDATISGVVRDASDAPVSGVQVSAITSFGFPTGIPVVTDADGAYTIRGLKPGSYRIAFTAPDSTDLVPEYYDDELTLAAADALTLTVDEDRGGVNAKLAAGGSLGGHVQAFDGSALPFLQVTVKSASLTRTVQTNNSGDYAVHGLPAGTYTVCFTAPFTNPLAVSGECYDDKDSGGDPVTVVVGQAAGPVNATLTAGGRIRGKVTKAGGLPVAGVVVTAARGDGPIGAGGTATTGDDGTYTIPGLSTASYKLLFTPPAGSGLASEFYDDKPSFDAATPVAVTRGQDTNDRNALLAAAGSLAGRVTGDGGSGLANVSVLAQPDDGGLPTQVQTQSDGTYTLSGLRAGDYRVSFTPQGGAYQKEFYDDQPSLETANPVTVTAGVARNGVDARLTRQVTVTGTVTAVGGNSLKNVAVTLYDAGDGKVSTQKTSGDGRYELTARPGTYRVGFVADGLTPEFFDNRAVLADARSLVLGSGESFKADAVLGDEPIPAATPTPTVTATVTATPTATATASPRPTVTPAPAPVTEKATLSGRKKVRVKRGRFSLKLVCGASGCTVKVYAKVRVKKKTTKVLLAKGTAGAGGGTVKLKLGKAGRKLIAKHAAKVSAVVAPKSGDPAKSYTLTLERK